MIKDKRRELIPMARPPRFLYGERRSLDADPAQADYLSDAQLFRRSYVKTIQESAGQALDSTTSWFLGRNVAFYRLVSNSCVEARRTIQDAEADGLDGVVIDSVASGTYSLSSEWGEVSLGPGDVGMVQTTIDVTARSRFARMGSLFLPRIRLVEEVENDLLAPPFRLRKINASLMPFLAAQLRLLVDHYGSMPTQDYETAIEMAAQITIALLRAEVDLVTEEPPPRSDILLRAMQFLQEHYHQHDLSSEEVGRLLGISRARLYREFATEGLTVAAYLRDLRLRRFVERLPAVEDGGIARLAWESGFAVRAADLTRLFKRAYGMTPRQARAALCAGHEISRTDL
jgi:AraC-like DNA-binding protein